MSTNSIVPRRVRRRPIPPEEAFAQWLARAATRDTEQGGIVEVSLAHGRIGQRHALHLESFNVDPEAASAESVARLAAEIWSVAETHAATFKGPQRYDVTALYGPERAQLAQTSFRLQDDEQDGDIIEGVIEQPSSNGWFAQTMRHREFESRAFRSFVQETLNIVRAGASENARDSAALAQAEVEKERIRTEEAERIRRFQIEQEDRAEKRRLDEEARIEKRRLDEEERAQRHVLELKTAEARAIAEQTSLETRKKVMEEGFDVLKIFVPLAAHRIAKHFGGGSLPIADNELLTAARLRGFLHALDHADIAKVTDALGGTSPKALGFLDLVSSVLFNGSTEAKANGTSATSATADSANGPTPTPSSSDTEPATASDEPPPSPLAQSFIQALQLAFAVPRSDAELTLARSRIQQELANSYPIADVEAVARFVERAGYTQIADLFQEHLRARRAES